MTFSAPNLNTLWGNLLIEELVRLGISSYIASPGSRSTPLVVAASRQAKATLRIHVDERGAGFFAVGQARATGEPAALICTSGTAAANYLPAVVEAAQDNLPLLVLTADRPDELRGTSANQTINQHHFYGSYARWYTDLPCPDESVPPERLLTLLDTAVAVGRDTPAGPVHLNCPFREPLAPLGADRDWSDYASALTSWRDSNRPFSVPDIPGMEVPSATIAAAADALTRTENGLVIIGRLSSPRERTVVAALTSRLPWPVLADITSGLSSQLCGKAAIRRYDVFLRSTTARERLRPDSVLHLGGPVTSKPLMQYLAECRPKPYVNVSSGPLPLEPGYPVTDWIEAPLEESIAEFTERATDFIEARSFEVWRATSDVAGCFFDFADQPDLPLTEPIVSTLVADLAPEDTGLFLASSMPVRDIDAFGLFGSNIRIAANRGASGIDGTIASAAGFASGLGRPTTLIIGDLAFLHDLNSLALLQEIEIPVVIVLINNNGGGIFSFLPIREAAVDFERLFGTPHGMTFEAVTHQFDLEYEAPKTVGTFVTAYQQAIQGDTSTIIEVTTDRSWNLKAHQDIYAGVDAAVKAITRNMDQL